MDILINLSREEIIEQFEDRRSNCKTCESQRRLIMLDEMPEDFIIAYKEKVQGKVIYDKVSFLYCYKCDEYSEQARFFYKKKKLCYEKEEVDYFSPMLTEAPF